MDIIGEVEIFLCGGIVILFLLHITTQDGGGRIHQITMLQKKIEKIKQKADLNLRKTGPLSLLPDLNHLIRSHLKVYNAVLKILVNNFALAK